MEDYTRILNSMAEPGCPRECPGCDRGYIYSYQNGYEIVTPCSMEMYIPTDIPFE